MTPEGLFKKGLVRIGLSSSKEEIDVFMTYLNELKRWNRAYNLTGLRRDEDIIIKHFLDSLLYLKAIPEGELSIADVGSGAGFPGIPIKILRPEIELFLIESSKKRAAFLRHIVRLLHLNKTIVYQTRIEKLNKEDRGRYDIIVSRATFKIEEFIKKACPYVKKGGFLVLSKGEGLYEEIKDAPYIEPLIKRVINTSLPFINAVRNLVVLDCNM
ncbi:MAG: hypothetical protein Fur0020_12690 [Thermodesulfovibrionia bacterium]